MSDSGCGRSECFGHGMYAVCGKNFMGEIFYCSDCLKKQLATLKREVRGLLSLVNAAYVAPHVIDEDRLAFTGRLKRVEALVKEEDKECGF